MVKEQVLVIAVTLVLVAIMVGAKPVSAFDDPSNVASGGDRSRAIDACQQPKTEGPCKALFPRYFYNTTTSSCDMFNYGGCYGNDNNFETLKMCQTACMSGK